MEMSEASTAFELPLTIEPGDFDELGHVNNVIYLGWVQEAAVAHWRTLASQEDQAKLVWVVLRHEIDYRQAAVPGDAIIARTWVGPASRIRFERHTELLRARDRRLLAVAHTWWCPLDAATGRPASVSAEVRALFSAESAGETI